MTERITSLQNPRIKNILHLAKANERHKQDLFVIEGFREILMALQSGLAIQELYVAPEVNTHPDTQGLIAALPEDCIIFEISKAVFEKVAYRDNSDGLIDLILDDYLVGRKFRLW